MGATRLLLLAVGLLLLATCGRETPPATTAGPAVAGGRYPDGLACMSALAARGVRFRKIEDFELADGCGMGTAVELYSSTIALDEPLRMSCPTAYALTEFEARVVQPTAQTLFGQPVVGIESYGAYACRTRSGGSGRLSEHALGRAIDIAAFELADGRVIRVDRHWSFGGNYETFLKRVARGACDVFNLVLTPNADASHWNHFHLDLGRWQDCQI